VQDLRRPIARAQCPHLQQRGHQLATPR
jgi:hypothetical protein